MTARNVITALAATLLTACSSGTPPPAVPRPEAYPRPRLYPADYVAVSAAATPFAPLLVNSSASVDTTATEPGWFNICYPLYDITVNCTAITTASLHRALENRYERMAINTAGNRAEIETLTTPAGTHLTIISSPDSRRTPLQFLATDSVASLLFGVVVVNAAPDSPADSIAPFIDAVQADLRHMLLNL